MDKDIEEGLIQDTVDNIKLAVTSAAVKFLSVFQRRSKMNEIPNMVEVIKQDENFYHASYLHNMAVRLQRALDEYHLTRNRKKWETAIKSERRFAKAHVDATRVRLKRAQEFAEVYEASREGALWVLGTGVQSHTIDCEYMGGEAWSWDVLFTVNPINRHYGCECSLQPIPEGYSKAIRNSIPPEDYQKYLLNAH